MMFRRKKRHKPSKKFLRRWVAALESGHYPKGVGALCGYDTSGQASYCCLGVAASIEGDLAPRDSEEFCRRVGGLSGLLPERHYGLKGREQSTLARVNDDHDTFVPVIAEIKALYPYAFKEKR